MRFETSGTGMSVTRSCPFQCPPDLLRQYATQRPVYRHCHPGNGTTGDFILHARVIGKMNLEPEKRWGHKEDMVNSLNDRRMHEAIASLLD
jgi:hypothetical protein